MLLAQEKLFENHAFGVSGHDEASLKPPMTNSQTVQKKSAHPF